MEQCGFGSDSRNYDNSAFLALELKKNGHNFRKLEESRIRDMEAESYNWSHFLVNV